MQYLENLKDSIEKLPETIISLTYLHGFMLERLVVIWGLLSADDLGRSAQEHCSGQNVRSLIHLYDKRGQN